MSPRRKKDQPRPIQPQISSEQIYVPDSDDKSKPLRRLWQMLTMLEESPDGLTISEMSIRLQTSTRTIRRYLECVQDVLGGDFETEKKRGQERRFMLSRQPIGGTFRGPTPEEKAALLVAQHVLSAMFKGTMIGRAVDSGISAICTSVSPEYRSFAEHVASRIARPILEGGSPLLREAFDVILKGIYECKSVRMTIDTNRQGERAETIFPYALERDGSGEICLLYFSCKEDAPAAIPVRRIRTAKPGETQFVFPADFDAEAHLCRAIMPSEKHDMPSKGKK